MTRKAKARTPPPFSDGQPLTRICECGCGGFTELAKSTDRKRGRIKGQPLRYLPGHQNRKRVRYVEEDRERETACWICQLHKNNCGYGIVCAPEGKKALAHRVAYEARHGAIPEGLEVHHLCGIRECVNPEHLEAVNHAENIRRGSGTKLTVEDVLEIRRKKEPQRTLAARYGIGQAQVSRIRRGQSWRDLA